MNISLDSDWHCVDAGDSSEDTVSSLSSWASKTRKTTLSRGFSLDITDHCVNYVLYLDSAPLGTEIFINGQQIARISIMPFVINVTMYVILEDNEIAFQVPANAAETFAGVRLRPVPCD